MWRCWRYGVRDWKRASGLVEAGRVEGLGMREDLGMRGKESPRK